MFYFTGNNQNLKADLLQYKDSPDHALDIRIYCDDIAMRTGRTPNERAQARIYKKTLQGYKNYLKKRSVCERLGHKIQETADVENGISYFQCERCGYSDRVSW